MATLFSGLDIQKIDGKIKKHTNRHKKTLKLTTVFGIDYDTPDGTCILDYIHIVDLCNAHLLAMQHLITGWREPCLQSGDWQGYLVREVIQAAESVT